MWYGNGYEAKDKSEIICKCIVLIQGLGTGDRGPGTGDPGPDNGGTHVGESKVNVVADYLILFL